MKDSAPLMKLLSESAVADESKDLLLVLNRGMGRKIRIFLLAVLMIPWATPAAAYSLLTHEQLIDLTWKDSIVPLLLNRYPNLTPAQLDQARAYAYGGCVIQDICYYPFGDHRSRLHA